MRSFNPLAIFAVLCLSQWSLAQRTCGSNPSSAEVEAAERQFRAKGSPKRFGAKDSDAVEISVYFHVIRTDETLDGGNIPDSQINDQITQVNSDYQSTGISFKLVNVNRVTNDTWFRNVALGYPLQSEMKNALHQGGAADLNVYTVSFNNRNARGLLGYATFPWKYQTNPSDDGVVIRYTTLPGGTYEPYNLGKQLTHEAGHWAGLYHTFQGGCEGEGDYVDDTPAQSLPGPSEGCPETQDSCPDLPGFDPVRNFMDGSNDPCIDQFTRGQIQRMKAQMATFRGL